MGSTAARLGRLLLVPARGKARQHSLLKDVHLQHRPCHETAAISAFCAIPPHLGRPRNGLTSCREAGHGTCPNPHATLSLAPPRLQTTPACTFTDAEKKAMSEKIQNAGTVVVEAKAGKGSATLSMVGGGPAHVAPGIRPPVHSCVYQ